MEKFERYICVSIGRLCNTADELPTHLRAFVKGKEEEVIALHRLASAIESIGRSIIYSTLILAIVFLVLLWKP
jgi:hypothetical protein